MPSPGSVPGESGVFRRVSCFSCVSRQPLGWFEVQQMATGFLLGDRGGNQGLPVSFWSWKLPRDLWSGRIASWRASNLVTSPREIAAGRRGLDCWRRRTDTCVMGGCLPCTASKSASLWHSVFPQIGTLLRNRDEREPREHRPHRVDGDASVLSVQLPKLLQTCQVH